MKRRTGTNTLNGASSLQAALDIVESLSTEEQGMLLEIIQHRLSRDRRAELVRDVAEARTDYINGKVKRGTVAQLMAELDS